MNQLETLSFLLIIAIFSGCSILVSDTQTSQIVGKWEWIRSTGGVIGETVNSDSAGIANRQIVFKSNSAFSFFRGDTLVIAGTYSFHKSEGETVINYDTETGSFIDQRLRFQGEDTLILADECYDCFINYYSREE
ncbi:hypothetical protein [Fodinibius sediminis]|nr:hypothetical protein [Fodinibius sediminis]